MEKLIDYVEAYFHLIPSDEQKGLRELHQDFNKQTYDRQTTYHQGSLCMSISEHKHGLSSTIDFKCNRKIFQKFPYVHTHKIPGGKYTKLLFQSKKLVLTVICLFLGVIMQFPFSLLFI